MPDGHRYIVVDILATLQGLPTAFASLNLVSSVSGSAWYQLNQFYCRGDVPYHWSGRRAFDAGTELTYVGDGSSIWDLEITAYDLTLP